MIRAAPLMSLRHICLHPHSAPRTGHPSDREAVAPRFVVVGGQGSAGPVRIEPMFDSAITGTTAPSLDELRALLARLAKVDGAGASEAELVDQLTAMEQLKSGLAA